MKLFVLSHTIKKKQKCVSCVKRVKVVHYRFKSCIVIITFEMIKTKRTKRHEYSGKKRSIWQVAGNNG